LTDEKSSETKNVVSSLKKFLQLRPILVRPLDNESYEIIEGHVVVDAARKAGLEELDCIVHNMTEEEALLTYLHLKLNRTVENHVKVGLAFQRIGDVGKLHHAIAWPRKRIEAYLELRQRDRTWQKFEHVQNDDGSDEMPIVE
jgi:hypothetical protein